MAEEIKSTDEAPVKRKPGRPRKETSQPLNEAKGQLQMEHKPSEGASGPQKITTENVQNSLTDLYNRMLGIDRNFSSKSGLWTGNIFNFNQYNPFLQNQRLKMLNTYPNEMDTQELTEAVSKPGGSEIPLRGAGWSLSSSQFLYYKILRLAGDIPMFKYYKIPELLDEATYKKDSFIEEDDYVEDWLEKLSVVNTFKKMSLEVKREGKPSYLLRNSFSGDGKKRFVNYAAFQKLPSDYVKLTGIGEHGYIASLNMLLFLNPAFSLDQYPDYIKDIWYALMDAGVIYENKTKHSNTEIVSVNGSNYSLDINKLKSFEYIMDNNGIVQQIKGNIAVSTDGARKAVNYMYWVQLPQDLCYTFCSDMSTAWAIPDTAGLFLGLRELTDYDTLAGLIQSTPLTALLTAEAECVNNPNPGQNQTVLSPETIAAFQDKFNNSTSTNLESFFAPLKNFKLLSLPNIPNSSDITSNATKNFISRAGLSGLIPATDKPSVAQIKGSQLIEEAACDYVTKQFESVLNFIINNLIGCKYKWNITLWGNIFTYSNELKDTKELVVAGMSFALPKLASAYNMSLRQVKAVGKYVNSLNIYDDFKTVTQVQQTKNTGVNNGETRGVGRPEIDVNEIDNDNTAASRESGLDTADMRDFQRNGKCIICGQDSDDILCEECRELYLEEV